MGFLLDQDQCLEAIRLARSYQFTIYDASYVALAAELRAIFVTADVRLARKLVVFAFVKTLDDFETP